MARLSLERDFTRFLKDPDFHHTVNVYFGKESLKCSGMLLAQLSPVFEKKIKDENGNLLLDEIIDLADDDGIMNAIMFLLYSRWTILNLYLNLPPSTKLETC